MRKLFVACAVLCAAALTADFASAAAPGQVSHNSLAQMGLAGLQPMSDVQGMSVRGKSFAIAGGFSIASVPGATSAQASAAAGYHSASSATGAAASSSLSLSILGFPIGSVKVSAAASGYATASAH